MASRPAPRRRRLDLLRVPVLGAVLRWRHARTALQVPFLVLAALVVWDGFTGPADAPRNVAGVVPWIQFRGFVALALLLAGNLFCMACPFMLPRRLAKKLFGGTRAWPSWLPGKWLAVGLIILFFWAYEALDLWASPWLTAWLVLAYFVAAFAIDAFFRGAAFCKHVCPIGQFNFVNSLVSPVEVEVRDADVCAACETKDCITGRYRPLPSAPPARGSGAAPHERGRLVQNGCELGLFQPKKTGNMDCTFCLDCVQACPHDNVGLLARSPARELALDPERSGVGRFGLRRDLAAMALVLVFAAFANAAGMIAPVQEVNAAIARLLGTGSPLIVNSVFFAVALMILPAALAGLAALASRGLAGTPGTVPGIATRFAWGLVPVGFGMWVAHYAFHLLGSGLTIVPVLQEFAAGRGWPVLGTPRWELAGILPAGWLLPLELLALEAGVLVALVVLWRIARRVHRRVSAARRAFVPWALLALLLGAGGAWILDQPMAMRGMEMPGMEMPGMDMQGAEMTETAPDMQTSPAESARSAPPTEMPGS